MSKNTEEAKKLISAGHEIIGDAAGAAIGFFVGGALGGPLGGAGGAAIGAGVSKFTSKTIDKVITDFSNRSLSEREKIKVGATAALAILKIQKNLDSGHPLRDDDFFAVQDNGRSDAEEIFEGALLKAKNEHEEKKTKFYANIFATISFTTAVSAGEANHILQVAEQLTYRQMCVLSLLARSNQFQEINLRDKNYEDLTGLSYEAISLLLEIYSMYIINLIAQKSNNLAENASISDSRETIALLSWGAIIPKDLVITFIGKRYYEAMQLHDIPDEDIKKIAHWLSI